MEFKAPGVGMGPEPADPFWDDLARARTGVVAADTSIADGHTDTFPCFLSDELVEALRKAFPLRRYRAPVSLADVYVDIGRQDVLEFIEGVIEKQKAGKTTPTNVLLQAPGAAADP